MKRKIGLRSPMWFSSRPEIRRHHTRISEEREAYLKGAMTNRTLSAKDMATVYRIPCAACCASYLSGGHSGRIGNEVTAWYRNVTYRGLEIDAPRGLDKISNSLRTGEIPASLDARRHLARCPTNEPVYMMKPSAKQNVRCVTASHLILCEVRDGEHI